MAEFDEKLNALLSNPDSMAQIMKLAQSLSGGEGAAAAASPSAAPPPSPPPSGGGSAPTASGLDILSSLTGGIDPKLLTRLIPLVQEYSSGSNDSARQLLYALRPYLKPERQDKVERALQLARLAHIARKFFAGWEG